MSLCDQKVILQGHTAQNHVSRCRIRNVGFEIYDSWEDILYSGTEVVYRSKNQVGHSRNVLSVLMKTSKEQ